MNNIVFERARRNPAGGRSHSNRWLRLCDRAACVRLAELNVALSGQLLRITARIDGLRSVTLAFAAAT